MDFACPAARGDGRAAAAPPRDRRRAGAGGDGAVPREDFVPDRLRRRAYADSALPIGEGQTISQPWIVAAICQALELGGGERVLEVGTGSGYSAASSRSGRRGVQRRAAPRAGRAARRRDRRAGAANVEVIVGDGSRGLPRGRRSTRSPSTPPRRRPPARCSGSSPRAAASSSRSPPATADLLTVFRRRGEERSAEDDRPLPLRPAARRGGLRALGAGSAALRLGVGGSTLAPGRGPGRSR